MLLSGKVHDGDTVLVDQTGGEHLELTAWPTDTLVDDDVSVGSITTDGDAAPGDGSRGRHAAPDGGQDSAPKD